MPYKPPYTTPSQIINLISEISQNLGKLETLNLNKSFQSLRKKSKVKSITGTLQIEGNTLTENQITGILDGKRVLGSVKEITEAKGAIELYERVDQFSNMYRLKV